MMPSGSARSHSQAYRAARHCKGAKRTEQLGTVKVPSGSARSHDHKIMTIFLYYFVFESYNKSQSVCICIAFVFARRVTEIKRYYSNLPNDSVVFKVFVIKYTLNGIKIIAVSLTHCDDFVS